MSAVFLVTARHRPRWAATTTATALRVAPGDRHPEIAILAEGMPVVMDRDCSHEAPFGGWTLAGVASC